MVEKTKNLFCNIFDYKDSNYPFQIFIGSRGTGKTYSALKGGATGEFEDKFIYMRRTKEELEVITDTSKGEGYNPFKAINKDLNTNIGLINLGKEVVGITERSLPNIKKEDADIIGYGVALSVIAKMRGFDFSDCSDVIYDECIPELHVKKMKYEFDALMNAYETMNRNRELFGKPPMNMYLLANSNNIYNPIFIGLGIVDDCEKMLMSGKHHKYYPERGLAIHFIDNNNYKEEKGKTALYKLTSGTAFSDMALENKFIYNDFSLVKKQSIKGFIPVCRVSDDIYIWSKKNDDIIYCSYTKGDCKKYKTNTKNGAMNFYSDVGWMLSDYFVSGKILFESYAIKQIMIELMKL